MELLLAHLACFDNGESDKNLILIMIETKSEQFNNDAIKRKLRRGKPIMSHGATPQSSDGKRFVQIISGIQTGQKQPLENLA